MFIFGFRFYCRSKDKVENEYAPGNFASDAMNSQLSHGSRKNASEAVDTDTKSPMRRGPSVHIAAAASVPLTPMPPSWLPAA